MTWGYFAMAHLSGMAYGHFVIQDRGMVLVFLGNFIACCVLIGIVTFKKMRWRQSLGAQTGDMQHEAS